MIAIVVTAFPNAFLQFIVIGKTSLFVAELFNQGIESILKTGETPRNGHSADLNLAHLFLSTI